MDKINKKPNFILNDDWQTDSQINYILDAKKANVCFIVVLAPQWMECCQKLSAFYLFNESKKHVSSKNKYFKWYSSFATKKC